MLLSTEVRRSRLAEVTPGDVLLIPNNKGLLMVALYASDAGGVRNAYEIGAPENFFALDDEDGALTVIDPVVRFDPNSAVPPAKAIPPHGSVLLLDESPAIFFAPPRHSPQGSAVTFTGLHRLVWRESAPAFTRWEVGVLRGSEFIKIAGVDVSTDLQAS